MASLFSTFFAKGIAQSVLDKRSTTSFKVTKFLAVVMLFFSASLYDYSSITCDFAPMVRPVKSYIYAQIAGETLYDTRVDETNYTSKIPRMRLHEKSKIFLIFAWLALTIPSFAESLISRSMNFKMSAIMEVFAKLQEADISPIQNYELTHNFLKSLEKSSTNFAVKLFRYIAFIIFSSFFSILLAFIIFIFTFGIVLYDFDQFPLDYYFRFTYPGIGGHGFVHCYWKAALIARVFIPLTSYLLIISLIIALFEVLYYFFKSNSSIEEIICELVMNNIGIKQGTIIRLVHEEMLKYQYSHNGFTVTNSSFDSVPHNLGSSDPRTLEAMKSLESDANNHNGAFNTDAANIFGLQGANQERLSQNLGFSTSEEDDPNVMISVENSLENNDHSGAMLATVPQSAAINYNNRTDGIIQPDLDYEISIERINELNMDATTPAGNQGTPSSNQQVANEYMQRVENSRYFGPKLE